MKTWYLSLIFAICVTGSGALVVHASDSLSIPFGCEKVYFCSDCGHDDLGNELYVLQQSDDYHDAYTVRSSGSPWKEITSFSTDGNANLLTVLGIGLKPASVVCLETVTGDDVQRVVRRDLLTSAILDSFPRRSYQRGLYDGRYVVYDFEDSSGKWRICQLDVASGDTLSLDTSATKPMYLTSENARNDRYLTFSVGQNYVVIDPRSGERVAEASLDAGIRRAFLTGNLAFDTLGNAVGFTDGNGAATPGFFKWNTRSNSIVPITALNQYVGDSPKRFSVRMDGEVLGFVVGDTLSIVSIGSGERLAVFSVGCCESTLDYGAGSVYWSTDGKVFISFPNAINACNSSWEQTNVVGLRKPVVSIMSNEREHTLVVSDALSYSAIDLSNKTWTATENVNAEMHVTRGRRLSYLAMSSAIGVRLVLVDAKTLAPQQHWDVPYDLKLTSIAVSDDARLLAGVFLDTILVYSLDHPSELKRFAVTEIGKLVKLDFASSGTRLFVLGQSGARYIDLTSSPEVLSLPPNCELSRFVDPRNIRGVSFGNGNFVLSRYRDNTLEVFGITENKIVGRIPSSDDIIYTTVVAEDEQSVTAFFSNHSIRTYTLPELSLISEITNPAPHYHTIGDLDPFSETILYVTNLNIQILQPTISHVEETIAIDSVNTTGSVFAYMNSIEAPFLVTVFNSLGSTVFAKTFSSTEQVLNDVELLNNGVYFVTVKGLNTLRVFKYHRFD